jgi:hypothetical protein
LNFASFKHFPPNNKLIRPYYSPQHFVWHL